MKAIRFMVLLLATSMFSAKQVLPMQASTEQGVETPATRIDAINQSCREKAFHHMRAIDPWVDFRLAPLFANFPQFPLYTAIYDFLSTLSAATTVAKLAASQEGTNVHQVLVEFSTTTNTLLERLKQTCPAERPS